MSKPSISAYCATYGRPLWMMGEVVESFLRQDYDGDSELVIFNDYADQTLTYGGSGNVRIVNQTERVTPLGLVFNKTVELCEGDILMPWESDDIFLPHRMSFTIDRMANGFFHTCNQWFYNVQANLFKPMGAYGHCNLAFTRDVWEASGGYVPRDVAEIDVSFIERLKEVSGGASTDLTQAEAFYIYMWGNGSYHASGWGGNKDGLAERVGDAVKSASVEKGILEIVPAWKRDYSAMAREWVSDNG